MAAEQEQGVIVFFSYARRDKMLRDRLEEHLSNLKYRGLIQTWHDRDILAGSDWLEQIDISMHNAQIILLLISSTFMASDYCYGKEMQQALQLHAQKKATVIPILLRPVLYAGAPFARLSMLPTNGKPVTSWRDRDSAFVDVALSIENIATHYVQNTTVSQPALPGQPQPLSGDSNRAKGATSKKTSCPFCSAETGPGDNFCLNCGNRLQPSIPSPQAAAAFVEPTVPAPAEWNSPFWQAPSPESGWNNPGRLTIAANPEERATMGSGATGQAFQAIQGAMSKIEEPAHIILRADNNEILHDYVLDKFEMSIGRAPNSDILLSKDKLTSRRHATILYENGQYSIRDERSANGTFVNSQQLDESSVRALRNGDHIGIGEHELVFQEANAASSGVDIESMPTMAVNPPSSPDVTFRTQEDPGLTASSDDEYGTRSMNGGSSMQPTSPQQESVPVTPAPVMFAPPPVPEPEPAAAETSSSPAASQKSIPEDFWQAPTTPPEGMNNISYQGETIGPLITTLSDEHAHLVSEAIRRAYYTESVAAYERILSHAPENDEALRGLGKALYGLARYDEALDAFGRALLARETPEAYAGLGDVLVRRKRYSKAVAMYKKACELDPDVTLDYPGFIHALREVGRTNEADQMYARAQDLGYFDDGRENMIVPGTNPSDAP